MNQKKKPQSICTKLLPCFILVVLFFLVTGLNTFAQSISNYTFNTNNTGSLVLDMNNNPLDMNSGTTTLISAGTDDAASSVVNIGFDFWLNGVRFTQFSANSNGIVALGATVAPNTGYVMTGGTTANPHLAAFNADLRVGASTGKVHSKLFGSSPNRVLVLEFFEMQLFYTSTSVPGGATWQMRFYESSNIIEYVYGSISVSDITSANKAPSIGFYMGATTGSFASVTYAAHTVSTTVPYAVNPLVSATGELTPLHSAANGSRRVYNFSPASPAPPSGLNFTSISGSAVTLNWTDNATDETGYAIYRSTDNINFIHSTTTPANTSVSVQNALNFGTTYYWKVFAIKEGLSLPVTGTMATNPAFLSGIKTVGTGGDYLNLTSAFMDINNLGLAGHIELQLIAGYPAAAETFPIVSSNTYSVGPYSVKIYPTVSGLSISGNNSVGTLVFDNANKITIDGRLNATGSIKDLIIENTNTTGYALRFINDASVNTLKYVIFKGVSSSATAGIVEFRTTTGSTGNDNNLLDFCDLRDGSSTPANGIFALGTTTATLNNSGNTISNCNIFNFFSATVTSSGINLQGGNTDWTITGNSFYQTATRTTTANSVFQYGITIANTTSGNNFIIQNNFIGGSAPNAASTPWTVTGAFSQRFNGIGLSVGTTLPSSVQGNVITNFNYTTTSTATANSTSAPLGTGIWGGIMVGAGSVNVGTVSGNTVGASTGTGAITVTGQLSGGTVNGIGIAGTGTLVVSNNNIGSITTTGSASAVSTGIIGIQSSASGTLTISNNTVGSNTTLASLNASNASTGTTAQIIAGINSTGGATMTINNNTIANVANAYVPSAANTSNILRGISTSFGTVTILGNVIKNMAAAANATGSTSLASVIGILNTSTSSPLTISGNTINNLANNHNSAAVQVLGIMNSGPSTGTNIIAKNAIYNLTSPSVTSIITGIHAGGGVCTYRNNMIALGEGLTNSAQINGINQPSTGTDNFYHNSVFIGGSGVLSGTINTFAFNSLVITNTRNFRNNIFYNARSNTSGTGTHFAIQVGGTTSNPAGLTTNNNILFANGTGGAIGRFNAITRNTLGNWQTATGQDLNSYNANPQFIDPGNAIPDLHIHPTNVTAAEASGADVGVTDDFDNQLRVGLTPTDMGADAGNFTGLDLSGPMITYSLIPNNLNTTTLSFTNVNISDISGVNTSPGTRPRVYFKKTTNTNTFNDNTNATDGWKYVESNGSVAPFDFTLNLALISGGVSANNVIQYFVVAQDMATPPNIGINSGVFNALPASVDLTAGVFPIGGTLNTYTILPAISGTKTICPSGCDFSSLTNTAGAFATINNSVVTGNINLEIAGNLTSETGANSLNAFTAPYTLSIYPTGTSRTISGSINLAGLIQLNGADRVTINGALGGLGSNRSLNISNLSITGSAGIVIASLGTGAGASFNTVKNCIITTPINGLSHGISIGIYLPGSSGADNDNITIQNNLITNAKTAIYASGIASTSLGGLDSLKIIGNILSSQSTYLTTGIRVGNAINSCISKNKVSIASLSPTEFNAFTSAGISLESGCTSSLISSNQIEKVHYVDNNDYSTNNIEAVGIKVATGNNQSELILENNLIYNVNVVEGTLFNDNNATKGISISSNTGGIKMYHNTILLNGNIGPGRESYSSALYIENGASNLDIRNNIFSNIQKSNFYAQKNYSIYSAASNSAFSTINNNVYYVQNTFYPLSAIPGYIGTNRLDLAAIQSGFGQNINSMIADPLFQSETDLRHNFNSPVIQAGASGTGTSADFLDIGRNIMNPSIGAYEIAVDVTAPQISNINLQLCPAINRVLTATIKDGSGVPQSGAGLPVLYWKINSGTYQAATANYQGNDQYSFSFGANSLIGDTVSYYIVLRDNLPVPVIGSYPAGASGFSADPPMASVPPANPLKFIVKPALSGVYNVGASYPPYTTLSEAIKAYNESCLDGPVSFLLMDPVYNTTSDTIKVHPLASAINTLTIKPAISNTTIIGNSSSATIVLLGADFITIDGSVSNNSNTLCPQFSASRNLNIINNASGSAAVIWVANTNNGDGANSNTVKNCNLSGNSPAVFTYFGILSGNNFSTSNDADGFPFFLGFGNHNNSFVNNNMYNVKYGISCHGSSITLKNNGTKVNQNQINTTSGIKGGIIAGFEDNIQISSNTISNFIGRNVFGISCGFSPNALWNGTITGREVTNASILNNTIGSIIDNTTNTAVGIAVCGAGSGNTLIANNMISGVASNGTNPNGFSAGIFLGGGLGSVTNIYYNTIAMQGTFSGSPGNQISSCLYVSDAENHNLNIKNNILTNTQSGSPGSTTLFNTMVLGGSTFPNLVCDNNNLFSAGTGPGTYRLVNSHTTLPQWQSTGFDLLSNNALPGYYSASNLHLIPYNQVNIDSINNKAAVLSVLNDKDCSDRDSSTPDIGADEFVGLPQMNCDATPNASTITGGAISVCAGAIPPPLKLSAFYLDLGITYQWKSSDIQGGPYTNTMGTDSTQVLGTLTDTMYYICEISCTNSGMTYTTVEKQIIVNPLPIVTVSPSNAVYCTPGATPVTLTAGGAQSYLWSPATGLSATSGNTVTATPTANQSYVVTGVNLNGCTNTAISEITLGVNPQGVTANADPAIICSGGSSSLIGTGYIPFSANQYTFSTASDAVLDAMTGASTIISSPAVDSGTGDDSPSSLQSLGFNFNFAGVNYTQCTISPDGWLRLGEASATAEFTNSVTSTANLPKIYALWDDLCTGTNGNVKVLVTGTAPFRKFIVQWFVTIPRNITGSANSTFQVWLYETTGKIEYKYGVVGTASSSSSGLTGPTSTLFQSITFSNNTSSTTTANNLNTTSPEANRVYTFLPPANTTFVWSPSNLVVDPTSPVTPTTSLVDNQTYTLSVSNAGCTVTQTTTINIGTGPSVNTQPLAQSKCLGQTATFTVAASGPGLNYQWRKNGVDISVGLNPTAGTPVLSISNVMAGDAAMYDVVVSAACGSPVTSNAVMLTVNIPLAAIIATPSDTICSGTSIQLSENGGNATSWSWSEGGLTSQQITLIPAGTTIYTVTVTLNGCTATASKTIVVKPTPMAVTVTPPASYICNGAQIMLTASGGAVSSTGIFNGTSGNINLAIPDNNATGVSHTLNVNNVPAGSTIDSVIVIFNITHTYDEDVEVSIQAPNGQKINLIADKGGSFDNFTNTRISSDINKPSTSTGGAPFSGTFKADATSQATLIGNPSVSTSLFSDLFSTINGNWTISAYDDESVAPGTLINWSIKIAYTTSLPASYSWSPATGLDMTTGASVIANPAASTIYTATSTINGCASSVNATVGVTGSIVTNTSDSGSGSLRAVINCASEGDELTFDSGVLGISDTLTISSGPIQINKSISINQTPSSVLKIKANGAHSIFNIQTGKTLNLNYVDIFLNPSSLNIAGRALMNNGNLQMSNTKVVERLQNLIGNGSTIQNEPGSSFECNSTNQIIIQN